MLPRYLDPGQPLGQLRPLHVHAVGYGPYQAAAERWAVDRVKLST